MSAQENIAAQSDSLIELLAAQCSDLEKLLSLAREETAAAKRNDFDEIMRIVTERDKIGGRLESHRQQIGEIRGVLENSGDAPAGRSLSDRIIETVNLTLEQDAKTRMLLTATREDAALGIQKNEYSRRHVAAYIGEPHKGSAYTRDL